MKEGVLDKSYFGRMVETYDEASRENPAAIRSEMARRLKVAAGSMDQVRQSESYRLMREEKLTMAALKYSYTAIQKIVRIQLLAEKNNLGALRAPGFSIKILELLKQQIQITGAQVAMAKTELSPGESEILNTCFNLYRQEPAYVLDLIESAISDVENEELMATTKASVNRAMMN
ncbi:MAG: hypothetical protein NTZ25_02215 [Candidatus Peregrinibacteria bacterium]|nr:hypothetical protein [Candidatus Peregrinibacteria bacterium]